jgi:hypothetical protein
VVAPFRTAGRPQMIDPESWVRVHQQDREREIQAAQRASLVRGMAGAPRRSPTRPLGPLGRSVGRTLVRVGLWLMVAE